MILFAYFFNKYFYYLLKKVTNTDKKTIATIIKINRYASKFYKQKIDKQNFSLR